MKLALSDRGHASLHQYLICLELPHLHLPTPNHWFFTVFFFFFFFFKHSSRFFFWVAFTSEVGTVLKIYVALTYRDFWRTSRRTNPVYEIVAAIVIPAGSNPGFLAPLAKNLTTRRTLILSLINILKSNAWHPLLFLSLVWLPKFNYRIVQSMSHAFIDWCIDAKNWCIVALILKNYYSCCIVALMLQNYNSLCKMNAWWREQMEQHFFRTKL